MVIGKSVDLLRDFSTIAVWWGVRVGSLAIALIQIHQRGEPAAIFGHQR
jgi:hypothetical protein